MDSIPRERHPEYYFEDGTVHFLVSEPTRETLYKLYPGLLTRRSSFFESLLSLPQPETQSSPREGTCDENPIILHDIIRREFDYLLTFLFGGYAGESNHQEYLISVLKLSTFFDISHGIQYAIAEFGRLSPFDTCLKLQLGRKYRVDRWIEQAFRDLLSRPLSSISRDEACRMGLECFYILVHTKAHIEEEKLTIACTPPTFMQGFHCTTPSQCQTSWEKEWWNCIAAQLLHPEEPRRVREIVTLVEHAEMPDICAWCKGETVAEIENSGFGPSDLEEILANEALRDVMALQKDEHIPPPLESLSSQVQ